MAFNIQGNTSGTDLLGGGGTGNISDLFRLFQQSQMTPMQSLATAIPAYQYAQNLNQYMQPAENTANAMVDINSPQYQQLYQQNRQQGQQNLADQIQQLSSANRKLAMMGRVPLFDQQRGGEQLFRQQMLGGQQADINAASQTQDQLARSFITQHQLGADKQKNAVTKSGVTGNVLGALASLFHL